MSENINIIVNCAANKKQYNIEIDLQTKVGDLISEFSQMFEQKNQQLIMVLYQGKPLNQQQTIASYGIKKGSELDLKLEFGIVVNFPHQQKVYNIEIDALMTGENLQKKLMENLVLNERISFKLAGQIIDPKKTLVSQGLSIGSQLEMHLDFVGGKNDLLIQMWEYLINPIKQQKFKSTVDINLFSPLANKVFCPHICDQQNRRYACGIKGLHQSYYNIQMNGPIKIIVNFAHKQKIYNIDIESNTKVKELVKEFEQVVEFNQEITFKFGGILMDRERTLASYGVTKGSQLDLNIEFVGGREY